VTAVEVYAFRAPADGPVEYLLLRRPSGLWQPACGKIEPHETPLDAARREAREETGATPVRVRSAQWADPFVDPEHGNLYFLPVFVAELPPDAAVRASREHEEARWFAVPQALEVLQYHGYRQGLLAAEATRLYPGAMAEPEKAEPRRRRRRRRGRGRGSPPAPAS
jgi:8-oxo-dGTP pyrophosphatase MutT (NUDIX family)